LDSTEFLLFIMALGGGLRYATATILVLAYQAIVASVNVITRPQTGEVVIGGTNYIIQWTTDATSYPQISIQLYSTDPYPGGPSGLPTPFICFQYTSGVCTLLMQMITAGPKIGTGPVDLNTTGFPTVANVGHYLWQVPADLDTSQSYFITIWGQSNPYHLSTGNFSIQNTAIGSTTAISSSTVTLGPAASTGSTGDTSNTSPPRLSSSAIVGIIVGVLAAVILICFIIYRSAYHRGAKQSARDVATLGTTDEEHNKEFGERERQELPQPDAEGTGGHLRYPDESMATGGRLGPSENEH